MIRTARRLHPLLIALPLVGLTGCAGARILQVEAPDRNESTLLVHCEVDSLAHKADQLRIETEWAGYVGTAPVPVVGGLQPELVTVPITNWTYVGDSRLPSSVMEVRFHMGRKILYRQRLAPMFESPGVLTRNAEPEPRPAAPTPRAAPPAPVVADVSTDLDRPTALRYPAEITCRVDAKTGSRYVRLEQLPDQVLRLVIDVTSHGHPSTVHEVTPFAIELLDSEGLALGTHVFQEFVNVGDELRRSAEWRFDGSPVIFKLRSGSQAGDTIKIRFEPLP